MMQDLRQVFTAANRANCSLYTMDPRGLAVFNFDIDQGVGSTNIDKSELEAGLNTLRTLADETDGRAILNSNDLVKGLAQMVKDASSYYLLGYTASSPTDGRFKQIRVRVKRPGLQVRARKGYWALSPDDVAAVTAAARGPPAPPDSGWRWGRSRRRSAPAPSAPGWHGARRDARRAAARRPDPGADGVGAERRLDRPQRQPDSGGPGRRAAAAATASTSSGDSAQ